MQIIERCQRRAVMPKVQWELWNSVLWYYFTRLEKIFPKNGCIPSSSQIIKLWSCENEELLMDESYLLQSYVQA
jgi:hypothetical protein